MLENMTKEELIAEVKRLRNDLYHLNMARDLGLPTTLTVPDGYAIPATKPMPVTIPADAPQAPLTGWPKNFGKPWLGAVCNSEEVDETIKLVEELIRDKKKAQEEDQAAYSGWSLRITDIEGTKFLYLKSPDNREMSLEVDTRQEVNGILNNPQVLTQFANTLGTRDIVGVWPRWWKMQHIGESFVLRRNALAYTITTRNKDQELLVRDFFKHLGKIRVPSIDAADGAL